MHVTDHDDIQVGRPVPRKTIRETESGYLAQCCDCQWMGLFPDGVLADTAVETHYQRCHYGSSSYTLVYLVNSTRAQCLESNRGRLTPIQSERPTFPRTTGDVSKLVSRGDCIRLPGDRDQMVVSVTEQRALGLPTWTVSFCGPDVNLVDEDPDWRGKNELIARNGDVYCRYGEQYLGAPMFETIGRAEHQADLSSFSGDRIVTDGGTNASDTDQPDQIILAFSPSNADHATDGHRWSLYNPSLENPYAVPESDEKLSQAVGRIDPHEYELEEDEHWIRLDWQSVMDGSPDRLTKNTTEEAR